LHLRIWISLFHQFGEVFLYNCAFINLAYNFFVERRNENGESEQKDIDSIEKTVVTNDENTVLQSTSIFPTTAATIEPVPINEAPKEFITEEIMITEVLSTLISTSTQALAGTTKNVVPEDIVPKPEEEIIITHFVEGEHFTTKTFDIESTKIAESTTMSREEIISNDEVLATTINKLITTTILPIVPTVPLAQSTQLAQTTELVPELKTSTTVSEEVFVQENIFETNKVEIETTKLSSTPLIEQTTLKISTTTTAPLIAEEASEGENKEQDFTTNTLFSSTKIVTTIAADATANTTTEIMRTSNKTKSNFFNINIDKNLKQEIIQELMKALLISVKIGKVLSESKFLFLIVLTGSFIMISILILIAVLITSKKRENLRALTKAVSMTQFEKEKFTVQ
jgi:hypothetical protein